MSIHGENATIFIFNFHCLEYSRDIEQSITSVDYLQKNLIDDYGHRFMYLFVCDVIYRLFRIYVVTKQQRAVSIFNYLIDLACTKLNGIVAPINKYIIFQFN